MTTKYVNWFYDYDIHEPYVDIDGEGTDGTLIAKEASNDHDTQLYLWYTTKSKWVLHIILGAVSDDIDDTITYTKTSLTATKMIQKNIMREYGTLDKTNELLFHQAADNHPEIREAMMSFERGELTNAS